MKKFHKPRKFDFNLVVIGGGSAGLVSAYIAAAVKSKVALIEKHKMGGDCLNTGCVPSKALIRSSKVVSYIKRATEFGLDPMELRFDFGKIMERVQRVIRTIEPHDSVKRYTELGVEVFHDSATIRSPYEIEIGDGRTVTSKAIIVATGATPALPQIPGLKEVPYLTSDTLWGLRKLPERLLVLGGGPIGCELAQCFGRLGSKVTLVEMSDRLLGREDPEVSKFIQEKFAAEGMRTLTGHRATRFESKSGENILFAESNGETVSIPFDQVMVALGRKANVSGFGLEELGVQLNSDGTIGHDEFLRTNYPNIFVCGDVAGPYQFTHTAAHQAWYASVNALFGPYKMFKTNYDVIPWATFTDPEVARVGLNETDAKRLGIPYEISQYGIDDLDRAIADEEAHGWIKVLSRPGKDKILGVTIVGFHASDVIAEFILAMKHGIGLNKILSTIHIYPTLAEANKYVAGQWKRAHAPQAVLKIVERFHRWRRGG